MTISDKIRIYELSRDLNLDNKDILDAAQKLSISVKSHSSSISLTDAKKIKNLINTKTPTDKIISVNKPSIKQSNNNQNLENKSLVNSTHKQNPSQKNINKKPLLIRPINKPDNQKSISNKLDIPQKPLNLRSRQSQPNLKNQDVLDKSEKSKKDSNNKTTSNFKKDTKPSSNSTISPIKGPSRPPIQLIEKPKNLTTTYKVNNSQKNNRPFDQKNQINRLNQNNNKYSSKNPNNSSNKNTPELVGAPIRRQDNDSGATSHVCQP